MWVACPYVVAIGKQASVAELIGHGNCRSFFPHNRSRLPLLRKHHPRPYDSLAMPRTATKERRAKIRRYRRARIRHFLFTTGPDRLSGGRVGRRHLAQGFVVREIEIASPLWPAEFDGLRIGHISDFHVGELHPVDQCLEAVECLAANEPDLVACTGDVVDLDTTYAGPIVAALGRIKAPLGKFLVLGNHDELHDPETLTGMALESGLTALSNEAVEINHNGAQLVVAGIEWATSAVKCASYVDRACGQLAHLLLSHNPKAFLRATDLGIAVTLAGHTHGGQVALKNRPNANLAISQRRSAGLFQSNGSALYVTTGIGAWFPLRVNCPAEIAIITVRHQPA